MPRELASLAVLIQSFRRSLRSLAHGAATARSTFGWAPVPVPVRVESEAEAARRLRAHRRPYRG